MLDLELGRLQNNHKVKEDFALCKMAVHFIPRLPMDHSAPILANADGLPEILTARELEALLRIDVKTIYRYVQTGLIPYLRMQSNIRFSKHQVLRWLDERFQPRRLTKAWAGSGFGPAPANATGST